MATAKSQPKRFTPKPTAAPAAEEPKALLLPEGQLTALLSKAELDALHDIALREPRSLTQFLKEATENVTLNEEVAAACVYALPFRNSATGTTEMVRGASARFAEILQYAFGNSRVGGFLLNETATQVIARGFFIDLQKNNGRYTDVPRSIIGKSGQRYSRDVITRTGAAAIAIAKRNAVLESIPQAIWQPVYKAALQVIAGDSVTLASRRQDALAYLAKQGAPAQAVFTTLGVRGLEDIGIEELATLRGLANAIRDGETTVEEAFFPRPAAATGTAAAREALQASERAPGAENSPPADSEPR